MNMHMIERTDEICMLFMKRRLLHTIFMLRGCSHLIITGFI